MIQLVVDLPSGIWWCPIMGWHRILSRDKLIDIKAVIALALEKLKLKFGLLCLFINLELVLCGDNLCSSDLLFLVFMLLIYLSELVHCEVAARKLSLKPR